MVTGKRDERIGDDLELDRKVLGSLQHAHPPPFLFHDILPVPVNLFSPRMLIS